MLDRSSAGPRNFCLLCSVRKTIQGVIARCFGSVKSAVFLSSLFSRVACCSGDNGFRLRVAGFFLSAALGLVVLDLVDLDCFPAGFLVAVGFFVVVVVAFFGRPGVAKPRMKA